MADGWPKDDLGVYFPNKPGVLGMNCDERCKLIRARVEAEWAPLFKEYGIPPPTWDTREEVRARVKALGWRKRFKLWLFGYL